MAVNIEVLQNGAANFVVHVVLEQDGASAGELVDEVLIDPADYGLPESPSLRLMEAWSSLVWFDVTLKFGGLVPRPIWTFGRDGDGHVDFSRIGGLSDRGNPPPSDDNGKIVISTNGFGEIGVVGVLVLAFRK